MTGTCLQDSCTVDTTGRCVLGNDPATCIHRTVSTSGAPATVVASDQDDEEPEIEEDGEEVESGSAAPPPIELATTVAAEQSAPPLLPPESTRRHLPVSRELGLTDLRNMMRSRPVRLIGVLGAPNAGKTATLVSLYLLAANAKLSGFAFRNSDSLLAFDQLARGARQWAEDGGMLAQLTLHTELEDPRRPSFLHIRVKADKLQDTIDLAFPDLPGEWSESFVDLSDSDRLQFLKGAEAIWLMVNGVALVSEESGQLATNRIQLLLSRIRKHIDPADSVPVILVITRRDRFDTIPASLVARIVQEAERWSLNFGIAEIAPFSRSPGILAGHGISELLDASLALHSDPLGEEEDAESTSGSSRQIMRYRRRP